MYSPILAFFQKIRNTTPLLFTILSQLHKVFPFFHSLCYTGTQYNRHGGFLRYEQFFQYGQPVFLFYEPTG